MRRTAILEYWVRGQRSRRSGMIVFSFQKNGFRRRSSWSAISRSAISGQKEWQSAVSSQQSAVSGQQSAVSNQKEWQSAVSSQQSAVSGQQSAVSNQKEWQSAVSSISGRDREIAPTKSGRRSWVFLSSIPCYFFIGKTTEIRGFVPPRSLRLGACCLTILIYIV